MIPFITSLFLTTSLSSGTTPATGDLGDPYWVNVASLLDASTMANGTSVKNDQSRHQHAFTYTGSAAVSTGKFTFNGTTDYLTVSTARALWTPGTKMTVEVFGVTFASVAGTQALASVYNAAVGGRSWVLFYSAADGQLRFDTSSDGTAVTTTGVAWTPTVGVAYDVTVTWDGSFCRFYVNGTYLGKAATIASVRASQQALRIGCSFSAGAATNFFNGTITGFRLTRGKDRANAIEATWTSGRDTLATTYRYQQGTFDDTQWDRVVLLLSTTAGGTIFDASPYDWQILNTGGVSVDSVNEPIAGARSVSFSGSNYLTIDHDPILNLANEDFTMEGFVRHTDIGTGTNLEKAYLAKYQSTTGNREYRWWLQTSAAPDVIEFGESNISVSVTTTTVPAINTWAHVAVAKNGFNLRLLQGGAVSTTSTVTGTNTVSSRPLYIGSLDGASNYMIGQISELRITKNAARYTGAYTTPTATFPRGSQVTADQYWSSVMFQLSFTGTDGTTTFTDQSRFANAVVANNGAAVLSNKLELDGTNDYVTVAASEGQGVPAKAMTLEVFGLALDKKDAIQVIICLNNGAAGGRSWRLYISATNVLTFEVWDGAAWTVVASYAWTYTLAQSYNVAAAWDGSTLSLYIDGTRVATGTVTSFAYASTFIRIGSQGNGSGNEINFLDGRMSAIRFTRRFFRMTGATYTVPTLPLTTRQKGVADTFWDKVILYLAGEGVDASTSFRDLGPVDRIMTANGTAQNDTGITVATSPSVQLGADGTFVQAQYLTDSNIDVGTPDFTMEAYVYCTDVTQNNQLFARRRNSGQYVFALNAGNIEFSTFNGTTGTSRLSVASGMVNNTVYHLCIQRVGSTYYAYVDGVLKGSATSASGSITTNTTGILIGDSETDQATRFWRGSVNHARVTYGAARYNLAGFTPPSVPYPTI